MNINRRDTTLTALTAISLALANAASAQSMQHGSMQMEQGAQTQTQDHSAHQAPTSKPAPAQKPATPAKTSEATIDHAAMGHAEPQANAAEPAMQGMDHSQMGHGSPASTPAAPTAQAQSMQGMDHSQMAQPAAADTSGTATPAMQGMDHSQMGHDSPAPATPEAGMQSMEGMDHSQMGHGPAAPTQPRTPIPAVTDADRKAAIAPEHAHPVHDNSIKSYVLLNRKPGMPIRAPGWAGRARAGSVRTSIASGSAVKANARMVRPSRLIWKCFTAAVSPRGGMWWPVCVMTSSLGHRRTSPLSVYRAWRR